jgi:hypothetical protein
MLKMQSNTLSVKSIQNVNIHFKYYHHHWLAMHIELQNALLEHPHWTIHHITLYIASNEYMHIFYNFYCRGTALC